MENTAIEYTTHTWSPWYGCTRISSGCQNCFAERWAKRFGIVQWGKGKPRRLASIEQWRKPLDWNERTPGASVLIDLCDPFDPDVDKNWREQMFWTIERTPRLTWLLLTKRPGHALQYWPTSWCRRPPTNALIGVSVEDQASADDRIPLLLKVPSERRWISAEPLLGPIDLHLHETAQGSGRIRDGVHWIVVGGESGPGARECRLEWVQSIVEQSRGAEIPCFVKQLGSRACVAGRAMRLRHPKGGRSSGIIVGKD